MFAAFRTVSSAGEDAVSSLNPEASRPCGSGAPVRLVNRHLTGGPPGPLTIKAGGLKCTRREAGARKPAPSTPCGRTPPRGRSRPDPRPGHRRARFSRLLPILALLLGALSLRRALHGHAQCRLRALGRRGARLARVGWRLTPALEGGPDFEVNLDAPRRESANDDEPPRARRDAQKRGPLIEAPANSRMKNSNHTTRTSHAILAIVVSGPMIASACEPEIRELPGQTRTGCFVDDALHGPGTVRFANGDVYEGSFNRGQRAGAGTLRFADGRRYVGAWANDRPEGHGVFTYPNGDRYEGSYRRGKRHGHGVLTTHAGARYDGEWVSDREHGQGRREWPDGRIYEGAFRDGRPHGAGRLTAQGAVFEFRFEQGRPVGEGSVTTAQGAVFTGSIVNGRFVPGG